MIPSVTPPATPQASNQEHFHWKYINQYQSGEIGLREFLPICCKPSSYATCFYLLIPSSDFFNKDESHMFFLPTSVRTEIKGLVDKPGKASRRIRDKVAEATKIPAKHMIHGYAVPASLIMPELEDELMMHFGRKQAQANNSSV